MASVQQSANMPQQNLGLPPNLTPQHVQEVYQKFRQMQEQGVRHDDPEYLKAHNLLSAVQRQQAYQKQRQMQMLQAQRQQQQPQQPQPVPQAPQGPPNGIVDANGIDGRNGSASANLAAPGSQDGSAIANSSAIAGNAASSGATPPNQKGASQTSQSFTSEQLATLRNQILAFKMISKNLAIPQRVQQQLFAKKTVGGDGMPASDHSIDGSSRDVVAGEGEVTVEKLRTMFETFKSPYDLLGETINYTDHGMRRHRMRLPCITPVGVDVEKIREDRELILYNRITARKAELAKLPANLGVWDSGESDTPVADDSLKLKALIEYKMLNLLPKQRAFRKQIQNEMLHFDYLAMSANRPAHRRMKKQSLREARVTEKLEKQQRDARETKEKQKQYNQLQAILNHGIDVRNAGNEQRGRVQKLGRLMMAHHTHLEREEQKRVERTAKQRLQALKANDEETYMKLLGQAKDSRISHLLKQTDGFLRQLAASVRSQQRKTAERYGDEDRLDMDEDMIESDDEEESRKVDYYAVAHRIKEEVTVQPSILVGGTLKEYQLRGLTWMISLYNNNLNGILADEMGLGKTIQTISLITYLIETKKQNGPYLVIVPLSTLTNWNLEFEKWAPSISRIVYKGPQATRKQHQQAIRWGNFQVLLTTYEFVIKDRPILSKVKWLHMIVDEGHRMKNAGSKLSFTLTNYYQSRYRLILTGTPLQNNLPELWALLNFALPNIFKSVKSFDEWFNTPFANTGSQDRMELTEEEQLLVIRRLHKVLRPFLLRRLKKDVEKDLPEKQERVIRCRFSALQAKLYKQLVTHNRLAVSDGKGGKTPVRGLSNMLMQL
ncbi:ATP-dependent DNA helicase Snf21, partial [Arthroderma sp. PD_2]